ncbi:hypothetical protein ACQJBY_053760 [Aegilops geniculata]
MLLVSSELRVVEAEVRTGSSGAGRDGHKQRPRRRARAAPRRPCVGESTSSGRKQQAGWERAAAAAPAACGRVPRRHERAAAAAAPAAHGCVLRRRARAIAGTGTSKRSRAGRVWA